MGDNSLVSGFVYDKETKEPLPGATVFIEGTKIGTLTNKLGFFALNDIPPGKYKLIITFIGYERYSEQINIEKNSSLRLSFYLIPKDVTTEAIAVEAEREIERREITVSKINVPVPQISKIRIGGESDLFRSLQYLPGVLTSSQISSGLFIRGGSPDQNLVLLDNMTVYNPSHIFGFISAFNTDAIKDVELIKGGFPAEFGGRISSVLNVTQKEGNRSKITGGAGFGLISSKAMLEGPVLNGSWFIGVRRTYVDLIKPLIPVDPKTPLPDFWFYDVNAKITQDIGPNNKFSLSGFQSQDLFRYGGFGIDFDITIRNQAISSRFIHILSQNIFTSTSLSYNYYLNQFTGTSGDNVFAIKNSIKDLNLKSNLDWYLSSNLTLKFGYELSKFNFLYKQNLSGTEIDTANKEGVTPAGILDISVNDYNHSLFAQANYNITDLVSVQFGLRANYWILKELFSFDPRAAFRYRFNEQVTVKFALGYYHQNIRLTNLPDFSFFDTWLPTDSTVPAISSMHYILSLETEPYDGFDLNLDFYYKTLNNITEINFNTLDINNVRDVFYIGNGRAYGAEIFAQKKVGRFVGWVGYALGFILAKFDSLNFGKDFRPKYDRRHDFKIVFQYLLDQRWEFSATFIFQSGQSYTGATSVLLSRLPEQNAGKGKIIPSQRYGLRLPPSHQLNLSAVYNFKTFGLNSKLILDIYNVYNYRDIWFRYYNTRESLPKVEDVRLLPIIPTISYELKF
ncbi:MAG: TonB-dependent receptor [Candidatus Kapaibacteriales bacterium]